MTKKANYMEENIEQLEIDPIGFCAYCKDAVYNFDEHVTKNNGLPKVYHIECWQQKNNIKEEVNFDA